MKRIFVVIFLIYPFSAFSQRMDDIAILPVKPGKGVTDKEGISGKRYVDLEFLTEIIREVGTTETNYRIMTKENVFAILRDKGIDPSKCGDVQCDVDIGRELQADKLVVGFISFIENVFYLQLRIYDVSSAAIDRALTKKCPGCGFADLVDLVHSSSEELFGVVKMDEGKVKRVKVVDTEKPSRSIGNFRLRIDASPYHFEELVEFGLDANIRIIGPWFVNLGIGGGKYPEYDYDDGEYDWNSDGFHLSLGTEVQYPLIRKRFFGLYNEPISLVGGFRFFEYILYNRYDTNHFGWSFYGGINLLFLYSGIQYKIMTSEECDYGYICDPSGFFIAWGLRFGF